MTHRTTGTRPDETRVNNIIHTEKARLQATRPASPRTCIENREEPGKRQSYRYARSRAGCPLPRSP